VSLPHHILDRADLRALVRGDRGPEVLRKLAAIRRSRTLLLLRGIRDLSLSTGHPEAKDTVAAWEQLARLHRLAPESVEAVLAYPWTGAWAARTAARLATGQTDDAEPAGMAALVAAAAVRGRAVMAIAIPASRSGLIVLPSLGIAYLPDPARFESRGADSAVLRSGSDLLAIDPGKPSRSPAGNHWQPVRRIPIPFGQPGRTIAIDPAMGHWLPAPQDGADHPPRLWGRLFAECWPILTARHPEVALDVVQILRSVHHLDQPAHGERSLTLRDAYGFVAMSRPGSALALALTLAHELRHAKLTVLMDLDPLVERTGRRYYTAWRTDPRPATGLIHGAYAHLGVTEFWRRELRSGSAGSGRRRQAEVEFARWRHAVRQGLDQLRDDDALSATGRAFIAEMTSLARDWDSVTVPAASSREALRLLDQHHRTWLRSSRDRAATPGAVLDPP
jgi:HEXXH motif-containing protein